MLLSFWLFDDTFTKIVTITFSSLIIIEILNIITILNSFSWIIFGSQIITIAIYFLSIIFLKDQINVAAIDLNFCIRVLIILVFAWLPIQIVKKCR